MNTATKYTLGVIVLVALIAGGVVYSQRSDTKSETTNTATTPSGKQAHSVTIANDREFLEHMVPHHQEAIDTSRIVASRTQNAEIKKLAETIIAAQTKEVGEMKAWYKNWYGTDFPTNPDYMPMMGNYETMPIQDLDNQYLSEMIGHHEGAIDTAKQIVNKAEHSEVKQLAQNVIDTQQGEIDMMRGMITSPAATMDHSGH
jgi:uncharacterized protein (DUF305 family)